MLLQYTFNWPELSYLLIRVSGCKVGVLEKNRINERQYSNLCWQELCSDVTDRGDLVFHMYTYGTVFSMVNLQRVTFCKMAEYV